MRNLNELINRFKDSLKTDVYVKETAQSTIKDIAGVVLSAESLSVKDGVLAINASPGIKSAIFLKEEKLITAFKERNVSINRIIYR